VAGEFPCHLAGWPTLLLADFVDAFDDHALAIYRAAVADLDRQHAGRDHWSRFEVDSMLLELADHDGDVDRAVDLLTDREHPHYGAIIARLREAGRDDEAVNWIDRAVAEGRVSGQGGGNDYWLSPSAVAETYRGLGRIDDAIAVLRTDFVGRPTVQLSVSEGDVARRLGGRRPLWSRLGMAGTRYARCRGSAGSRCRSVPAAARERPAASLHQALPGHCCDAGNDGRAV
jgi:hypothetical protein